jgi:ADP-ribosylglycohydrolase
MRVSPLGIFGAGRPAEAAEWARADSRLTHPNQVCQDSCAVFVSVIAHAIWNGGTPSDCYQKALEECGKSSVDPGLREAVVNAADGPPQDFQQHQGWVLIALQNAFYQLLHAPSLEEGVIDTVMRGGDTDTNAAIAGALLGAVYGIQAIPPRWSRALLSCRPLPDQPTDHPRPAEFWPVDAMILAEALLATGTEGRE